MQTSSRLLLVALFAVALTGCETAAKRNAVNYQKYLETAQTLADREEKPLVQIEAMPGASITGLKSITVYAPKSGGDALARLQAPQREPGLIETLAPLAGTVVGGVVQGYIANTGAKVAIAQSNNATKQAESNNNMLLGIVQAGAGATTSVATAAFASNERGMLAAWSTQLERNKQPTYQFNGNSDTNITFGTGNTSQTGRDNRNDSAGPCVNTQTNTQPNTNGNAGTGGNGGGTTSPGGAGGNTTPATNNAANPVTQPCTNTR